MSNIVAHADQAKAKLCHLTDIQHNLMPLCGGVGPIGHYWAHLEIINGSYEFVHEMTMPGDKDAKACSLCLDIAAKESGLL